MVHFPLSLSTERDLKPEAPNPNLRTSDFSSSQTPGSNPAIAMAVGGIASINFVETLLARGGGGVVVNRKSYNPLLAS
eukprot:scaffold158537_cov28-Tisochrysis_lutea.AAC.5